MKFYKYKVKTIKYLTIFFLILNFIFFLIMILFKSTFSLILFISYFLLTIWLIKAHKPSNRTLNRVNYLYHLTNNYDAIIISNKIYPSIAISTNYSRPFSYNLFGFANIPSIFQFSKYYYSYAIKIKLTDELKQNLYIRYIDKALLLSVSDMSKVFLDLNDLEYEFIKIN